MSFVLTMTHDYPSGDMVEAVFTKASGSNTISAVATGGPFVPDTTAPTVTSITRGTGSSGADPATTDSDVISWFVTFSEDITRPAGSDFAVTGTTSPVTVSHVNNDQYEISLAGGDVATVNGTVTLNFAGGQTITDAAGNALVNVTPSGANDNFFNMVNNTVPAAPSDLMVTSIVNPNPENAAESLLSLSWTVSADDGGDAITQQDISIYADAFCATPVYTGAFGVPTATSGNVPLGLASFTVGAVPSFTIQAVNSVGSSAPSNCVSTTIPAADTTAPTFTTVSIASNNADDVWAKSGDVITLTLQADEPLAAAPTVTIAGQAASVTGGGANWSATTMVAEATPEGPAAINISAFEDANGNAGTAVTATTDMSAVTVDVTRPTPTTTQRKLPLNQYTNADSLTFTVNFSEPMINMSVADFREMSGEPGNREPTFISTTTGQSVDVTFADPKFANMNRLLDVTLTSFETATDRAGNQILAGTPTGSREVYNVDNIAPILNSISRISPTDEVTDNDSLYWAVRFSEFVENFNPSGLTITGTTADVNAGLSSPVSERINVRLTGGDLPNLNGTVSLAFNAGHGLTDRAGNAWVVSAPDGANESSYTVVNDVTAPTLSGVAMTSNNASPEWAKAGDVITLTFTADEALQTPTVTIAGQRAGISNVGNNYTATTTVGGSTLDGQATFNISYSDLAGNAGTAVSNDTLPTLQRVDIITTIPTLTEVTAVASPTMDATPDVVLSSSAGGDIVMNEARCALPAPVSRSPGNHTITFDTLADGVYNCTAVLTDSAGNQSLPLTLTPFVIDTSAPVAPTALDMVAASDSGDSDSDNLTNVRQPTFTVTVPADAANVLFFANGAQIGMSVPTSTTVTYMSYTSLDDGDFSITAKSVDAAGNESAASSGLAITIDGTAPTTSITSTETGPVTLAGFPVTVTFSEPVVSTPTVTPGNGGAGTVTTDDNTIFNFRVFPDETGPVTVDVAAGTTADLAGNLNVAAPQFSINADVTNPTIVSVLRGFNGASPIPETTSLDVVSWFVKFSEDIIRPVASDFDVTGTTSPITISEVNADEYEISLAGGDIATVNGTVTLSISRDNEIKDVAGNGVGSLFPSRANENSFIMDNDVVAPTAELSQPNPAFVSGPFTLSVTLSEPPAGFTVDDFTVINGTASNLQSTMGMEGARRAFPTGNSFLVTITPTNPGEVTVSLPAGSFQDTSGNDNIASNTVSVTFDNTRPTLSITSNVGSSVSGPFVVTLTFSEDVDPRDGFGGSRTVVGNGTVTDITTVSDSVYTLEITPSAEGTVTLDIQEDAAFDIAGNFNIAATQFSIVNDTTLPTVLSVTRATPVDAETDADTLVFAVTFSEPVANIDGSDFAFTGTTATAAVAAFNATTYQVTASGGDLADINAEVGLVFSESQNITDNTGANALAATTPSGANQTFSVINDAEAPTVLIESPLDGPVSGDVPITVTFSEDVIAFTVDDLTVGNGTASEFSATSDSVYTATVTPNGDGLVTVDVAAASAQDSAGNDNTAAPQFSITSDATVPTVAITSGSADPVSGAFTATFTFSEDVTGFALGDITVGNGAASGLDATSGAVYTATITPTADGVVTVDVAAAAAQDSASNDNIAATQFSITSDATVPTVAITSGATDPVSGAFTATFTFSEDVTGFVLADITIGNGAASAFDATDGAVYTALITPTADGLVTVDVAAASAQDSAGNDNIAATQFSITSDATVPTVAITSGATDPVSGAFTATFTFSEDVTGFVLADITIGNGAASAFDATDGAVYTALITPTADGLVTVDVAAATAQDSAGNDNIAATQFSITSDATVPTVAITSGSADPVSGAFTATFTFSEDVTGFALGDITVGNGVASAFDATDGAVYTATITPTADGLVTVDVAAASAQDSAGNDNTAAPQFSITSDATVPTVAITSGSADPVSGAFTATFTFSEDVTGFALGDITVGNGAASGFNATDGAVYTALITPNADGVVTIDVAAAAAQDSASNDNIAAAQFSITSDATVPTVAITSGSADPVSGAFTATFTFSEDVTGFALGDITVGNGAASGFNATDGAVYTALITPNADGVVTIDVAAAAAQDSASNDNIAAAQFSITSDSTVPTVAITSGSADPVSGAFTATFTFSEDVTGFVLADITVGNGVASGFDATDGAVYTALITPTADGLVTVDVAAATAQDSAGNDNIAATQFSITSDATVPTVAITSGSADPVSGAFTATFTFSEDVTGFALGDITVGNGVASGFDATDGAVYTALITPTADGLVTVDVAAATAQDSAGNDNIAATQFSITSDATVPTVAITSGSADPVSGAFTATFTFSEDVTGFALGDITVGNGVASAFDATDGAVYTATITPTADGLVTVDVAAASAQDSAGNDNTAAPQFSITSDATVPTVAITSGSADPVSGAFTATFTFSEDVTGFALGDITVGNGAASGFNATDGAVYTALITPTADGLVTVDVAAAAAQDSASNDNIAAAQFSITSDSTVPTVAITSGSADPVSGAFTATFTFSEDVTGFALGDITIGNGAASAFDATDGAVYTALITPTADGLVTVDVAAASAQDSAGNDNIAATRFSITSDATVPTVAITSGATDPVSGAFTATFTFSEDVTGFALGDITVGNGAASGFNATDGAVYTALITPTADGLVTVDVAAASAQDSAGNDNIAATQFSITSDATVPTVAITSGSADPVSGAFTATFTFSEDVTGFALGDITVGNGAASGFNATDGAVYTALITPTADGLVTVDVAAASAQDSAGNDNTAAPQFSITSDSTVPTVTASVPPSSVNGLFDLVLTFSEDMTGLAASDLTVANGSAALSGGPREFTVTITPDGNGDINVDLPANVATDAAGNGNQALAETVTVLFDATAPTVTSSAAPSSVNGPFDLVFTFSEPMTGLTAADFGITNGTVTLTGGPLVFVATITPDGNGDISVKLPANVATDPAGNGNAAIDAIFEVTFDPVPPTVTVSTPPSSTNGPFDLEFSFSEDMTGLTASDFDIENGTVVVSGGPRDFIVTITPDGNGNVSVTLPENVATDPAGNGNEAFETVINVNFDVTTPSLSLSTDKTDVTGPFTITATFSEAVTGFTADDITVENGTVSDFSGDETVFSALVTPLTIGDVVITVADGAADDLAGNASAGDSLSVTAIGGEVTVELDLTTAVLDASTVSTEFSLSNPGSEPIFFTASSDQPWVDVTPGSGKIDTLSNIDFNIQLNDAIDELAPGTYIATVTVEIVDGPDASAKGGAASNAVSNRVLAQVPVTVNVEERFGNFELIVLTPTSPSNGATFTYTSSITALNALSVPGNAGEVRTSVADLINGAYTLAQSVPDGYKLTSIRCSGDADGGTVVNLEAATVEIDLDASESISCIFENTRDEDAIRLATQRSIRNFMARRGDRVLEATPDLSQRFATRRRNEGGQFSATGTDLRTNMNLETSLSGFRNRAIENETGSWTDLTQPNPSKWDVWASAEYTRYEDERADSGIDGKFFAAQFGADYLAKPNLIVGAMVQYDWMSEFDKEPAQGLGTQIGAEVSGDGLMAGPYFVWQAKEQLIVDVVGLWGQSENEVNPLGYYSDTFETDRFLVRANVTGEFVSGPWRLRPQVSLSHYEDKQSSYVDSLAIDIPEQTVTIGRLRAGPELVWTHQTDTGAQFEIGGSLRAVWNYNGAGLMDQSGRISGGSDPVRADGDISVGTRLPNGIRLRASAGFDGIGKGDFSARSGRLELVFPFGGQGGNGTKESSEELAVAGFQRACEAEAYLRSFNIGGSAACSGEPRKNLLETNMALMAMK